MSRELTDNDFVPVGTQQPDNAIPRFYPKACKNNWKSNQEGKPVFDTKDYVEILMPGDRLTVVNREVQDRDKARWPKYWAAYQAGQALAVEGTPLEEWTLIDLGQVETLKFFNVRSVEQVSTLTDAQVQRIGMGMMEMRQKARVWLEQAKSNSGISQVVAENQRLSKELEQVREQMGALARDAQAAREAALAAPAPAAPASAPALDPAALQAMIAQSVAAAVANLQPAPAAAPTAPPPKEPAPVPKAKSRVTEDEAV